MKYLLDTNICIYLIKNKPRKLLDKIYKTLLNEIAVSSVTIAEMEYGIAKSTKPAESRIALMKFLLPFEIIDFTEQAAPHYGSIRYDLQKKGTPIGNMDLLIASIALVHRLTLVTNNVKEFSRIDNLKVEDWTN
ncbi:MAG: type II toxin-antitoxin system VapC family toxin [Chloroflexota bacterium]|nr:type II toxin-antitoxin system VapC family toxin [Chloroflexota bacterium]